MLINTNFLSWSHWYCTRF